jgi:hypothetical protein
MFRSCLTVSLFALAVGLAAATSSAAPIIDGMIGAGEYAFSLADAVGEPGLDNPGLDIKKIYFDKSAGWYSTGLDVVTPPLDKDGGATSRLYATEYYMVFYDTSGTTGKYVLDVMMNAAGVQAVTLVDSATSLLVPLVAGADYTTGLGNSFEIGILASKMPNMPVNPYVFAQLDDTGAAADDQVQGALPEPATLGLLGLGAAAVVAMRRRKR